MSAAPVVDTYARLGQVYLDRERTIKREIAVVGLLWLVGCPVLCLLPDSGSLYGMPDDYQCGLFTYSISASMTGHYPKVLGSIMATLFAMLVVQRSSSGLCGILKLGWMVRFSALVPSRGVTTEKQKMPDEETRLLALKLWRRIEKIEFLGYLAGCFLIGLVTLDSKYFLKTHCFLATLAFYSLYQQNWLVGTLGRDFPTLFPNWTPHYAKNIFYLAFFHICLMYFFMFFVLGTMNHRHSCDDFVAAMESMSIKVFGNPSTLKWLASVAFWYTEYAFALMCVYVQLLEHYDLRVWEFAGDANLPYGVILSRFSISGAIKMIFGGVFEADIFMGNPLASWSEDTELEGEKVKTG